MSTTDRSYIVVDGSHLFANIDALRKIRPELTMKANLQRLSDALISLWVGYSTSIVRVTYYFRRDDPRIKKYLEVPLSNKPNARSHWQIVECGQKSDTVPEDELNKLPAKYRDNFRRGEKGVDMELACDVLLLAAQGHLTNVVLMINDRDYKPLLRALQRVGANIYITSLASGLHTSEEITDLSDLFQSLDSKIDSIFGYNEDEEKSTISV